MANQPAEIAQLTMATEINAPPDRVWKALTDNIGEWWPVEFFAGGEDGKRSYICEAHPGGRMFEQWDDGGGLLWGTVICAEPNVRLQVLGVTFPNWGGPSLGYVSWDLSANDNGTTLTFSESMLGRISEANIDEKNKGWAFLCNSMKAYVEGDPPPAWQG